jgi:hypothetical protein
MSAPENIHDEVLDHLDRSVRERQFGVSYGYTATWAVARVQGPQGPVQAPVWTLMITRRSPLVGGLDLHHFAQIVAARPTFRQVDEQVADGLRQLAGLFESLRTPPGAPPAGPAAPPSPLAVANGRRHR